MNTAMSLLRCPIRPSLPAMLVALAVIWFASPKVAGAATPEKPNIVLIMADDVGYECFGCYGSGQYRTPQIDRMAERGIRFDHCYSQPLCTPSRVKLMTGISNARNYSAFSILNRDQQTFAHLLRDAGYRTAVVGKWQLFGAEHYPDRFRGRGTLPGDAGFQRHCLWQVDRLGERHWGPLLNIDGRTQQFSAEHFGPQEVTEYALDFMAENRDRPFLLYYPMILPHSPFVPTPDSEDRKSKNRQQNFEDMVAYIDTLVGRLVQQAEDQGMAERTLILFTSDNGTHPSLESALGSRRIRGGKGRPTDAGTRVPLVGYWPGTIPSGQVCQDIVDLSDFLPTLMETAGAPVPSSIDGRSFLPQLRGEEGNPREWIYIFSCPRPGRQEPVYFARDQRWKLYGDGRFFDIARDPLEEEPLPEPEPATEAAATKQKLAAALAEMPSEGQMLLRFAE